jgi:hypothetical protein
MPRAAVYQREKLPPRPREKIGAFVISLLHPHHNTKSTRPGQWFDKPAGAWAGKLTILSPVRNGEISNGVSLSKDCPCSHPNQIVGGSQTSLGHGLAGAGPNPEAFGGHFLIEIDTLRE